MLKYKDIENKPGILRTFSGLTKTEFESLTVKFKQAYEESLEERDRQRAVPRQRKRGGEPRERLLSVEDKLLFILFYFKIYPLQEVQAYIFGMNQPAACKWIQRLAPCLDKALGYKVELPARKVGDLEDILKKFPSLEFITDGTERPIQRPKDPQRQKRNYNGKKETYG